MGHAWPRHSLGLDCLISFQVAFPMELDVYDLCSTELKAKLDGPRSILKDEQDRASAAAKLAKNKAKQTVGATL